MYLRQQLPAFEQHWIQATGGLNAPAVAIQIPRSSATFLGSSVADRSNPNVSPDPRVQLYFPLRAGFISVLEKPLLVRSPARLTHEQTAA